ncbi:MAG: hypothetical protein R2826_05480 [Thermoleophilia bacterium]
MSGPSTATNESPSLRRLEDALTELEELQARIESCSGEDVQLTLLERATALGEEAAQLLDRLADTVG